MFPIIESESGSDIKIEMYDALLYAHIFATKKLKFDYFTVAFCRVLQKMY